MKKNFLTFILFLFSFVSFAQNGGISAENNSLILEFVGFSGSMVIVKTTNKNNCNANIRVQWGSLSKEKNIGPLGSDTFHLEPQSQRFIRAHSNSNCGGNSGTVEIDYLIILPITFEFITVKQVSKEVVNIKFKVSECDGTDRFNIQISKDGKNYKTVEVILSDEIVPNKIYNVNVKI